MDMQLESREYNVLGHNIRLKETDGSDGIKAREVVDFLEAEISAIKDSSPALSDSQVAVLLALKMAEERLTIEKDFRENIMALQNDARNALKLVEEVSPTTH